MESFFVLSCGQIVAMPSSPGRSVVRQPTCRSAGPNIYQSIYQLGPPSFLVEAGCLSYLVTAASTSRTSRAVETSVEHTG